MTRRLSGLSLVYWLLVVLLYVPILILFVFSLNAGTTLSFPLKGFTFDWYGKILTTSGLLDSVQHSIVVAQLAAQKPAVAALRVRPRREKPLRIEVVVRAHQLRAEAPERRRVGVGRAADIGHGTRSPTSR